MYDRVTQTEEGIQEGIPPPLKNIKAWDRGIAVEKKRGEKGRRS